MSGNAQWSDLMPRVISALVMASIGLIVILTGGWLFTLAIAMIAGAMTWEVMRMFMAPKAISHGVLCGFAVFLSALLPSILVLPILGAAVFVSAAHIERDKGVFIGFSLWVLLACFGFILLRHEAALTWMLWLVLIVIGTDIAGYFAGRILGGPKFWPAISPKKTWSGTVAGWAVSAIVGVIFIGPTGTGFGLVVVSVVLSFSSQMGDIAESAIKRRMGVKDSSNLIPGHGGFLDRFDGMMGASVVFALFWVIGLLSSGAS
ncbi:phosphatidate cytidylyltransferase [Roseovarius sp. EL26]|uniref:phosphatidate cytidylyltransferase n=1 Tax=Roseovarius sp. EL26 TaxID=2126672 RepID=UPI000EA1A214|nr:phosphatidate cytidylyltransferase [Roseovarius sp. EL26]